MSFEYREIISRESEILFREILFRESEILFQKDNKISKLCEVIVDSRHFEIKNVRLPNGPGSNDICGPVQSDSSSNTCMLTYKDVWSRL